MGTRRSRHNKGRKPLYKEHRLVGNVFRAPTPSEPNWGDDAFLFSQAAKQLTRKQVEGLSDTAAVELFRTVRWVETDGKPQCQKCGSLDTYRLNSKPTVSRCSDCRWDISWTAGTIFSGHNLPVKALLLALVHYLTPSSEPASISAACALGLNYKNAWWLTKKIRERIDYRHRRQEVDSTFVLGRPRYMAGLHCATRTWWTAPEKAAVEAFASQDANINDVAEALGRSATSIAHRARDSEFYVPEPWLQLIAPPKPKIIHVALQYPYIVVPRAEHATVLEVNGLIPKGIPDHMRSDMCQEIMLAILEGRTTLNDLRARKDNAAFFIKKFYYDNFEASGRALSFDNVGGDERSYDEAAISVAAKEWHWAKADERGRYGDALRTFSAPTQEEDAHMASLLERQARLHEYARRTKNPSLLLSVEELEDALHRTIRAESVEFGNASSSSY